MREDELRAFVAKVQSGEASADDFINRLKQFPFQHFGDVRFDSHRELRCGVGEVVFAEGKSCEQLRRLLSKLIDAQHNILVTRVTPEQIRMINGEFPKLEVFEHARVVRHQTAKPPRLGKLGILTAGTSDVMVGEEVRYCAEFFGLEARCYWDVGVAGLQRVLSVLPELRESDVLVVVAGMEGTLPGVVAGLVDIPVIGVPSSVGYGVATGGYAALSSMLSSCSLGLSVVNIDNGIGAAAVAAKQMRIVKNRDGAKSCPSANAEL